MDTPLRSCKRKFCTDSEEEPSIPCEPHAEPLDPFCEPETKVPLDTDGVKCCEPEKGVPLDTDGVKCCEAETGVPLDIDGVKCCEPETGVPLDIDGVKCCEPETGVPLDTDGVKCCEPEKGVPLDTDGVKCCMVTYTSVDGGSSVIWRYNEDSVNDFDMLSTLWEEHEKEGWKTNLTLTLPTSIPSNQLALAVGLLDHITLSSRHLYDENLSNTELPLNNTLQLAKRLGYRSYESLVNTWSHCANVFLSGCGTQPFRHRSSSGSQPRNKPPALPERDRDKHDCFGSCRHELLSRRMSPDGGIKPCDCEPSFVTTRIVRLDGRNQQCGCRQNLLSEPDTSILLDRLGILTEDMACNGSETTTIQLIHLALNDRTSGCAPDDLWDHVSFFPHLRRMCWHPSVASFMKELPLLDWVGPMMVESNLTSYEQQALQELVWDLNIWNPPRTMPQTHANQAPVDGTSLVVWDKHTRKGDALEWYIHGGMATHIFQRALQLEREHQQKGLSIGDLKERTETKFASLLACQDIDVVVVVREGRPIPLQALLKTFSNDRVYVVDRTDDGFVEVVDKATSTRFQFTFRHDPALFVARHDMNVFRCMLNASTKCCQPGCLESIRAGRTLHDQALWPTFYPLPKGRDYPLHRWAMRILKAALKGFTVHFVRPTMPSELRENPGLIRKTFAPAYFLSLPPSNPHITEMHHRLRVPLDRPEVQRCSIAAFFGVSVGNVVVPSEFQLSTEAEQGLQTGDAYRKETALSMLAFGQRAWERMDQWAKKTLLEDEPDVQDETED